jgi:hypothetical protein
MWLDAHPRIGNVSSRFRGRGLNTREDYDPNVHGARPNNVTEVLGTDVGEIYIEDVAKISLIKTAAFHCNSHQTPALKTRTKTHGSSTYYQFYLH